MSERKASFIANLLNFCLQCLKNVYRFQIPYIICSMCRIRKMGCLHVIISFSFWLLLTWKTAFTVYVYLVYRFFRNNSLLHFFRLFRMIFCCFITEFLQMFKLQSRAYFLILWAFDFFYYNSQLYSNLVLFALQIVT